MPTRAAIWVWVRLPKNRRMMICCSRGVNASNAGPSEARNSASARSGSSAPNRSPNSVPSIPAPTRVCNDTALYARAPSNPSMISSSLRCRYPARSAIVGDRPNRCANVAVASLISSFNSCNRRGTRMSHVRSRKCRLISPTIVGTAYAAKSLPYSGSNRSIALINPTVAICTRSSNGSPRPWNRCAKCRANGNHASIARPRSRSHSAPSAGTAANRRSNPTAASSTPDEARPPPGRGTRRTPPSLITVAVMVLLPHPSRVEDPPTTPTAPGHHRTPPGITTGTRHKAVNTPGHHYRRSGRCQQALAADHLDRERLVPDVVEEHHHAVLLVAQHQPLAPRGMADRAVHRERPVDRRPTGLPGRAPVAVPARPVQVLAEAGEQGLAPAAAGLRDVAHHLDPRTLQPLVALGFGQREGGRAGRLRRVPRRRPLSTVDGLGGADPF